MDRPIDDRFSTEEYRTLRTEQIQRIMLMNSQTSGLTTTILSTWGPVLTIFIAALSPLLKNEVDFTDSITRSIVAVALLIQSVFLACSTLLMYPLSIKGRENLRQIIAIGAYIQVFYEAIPVMRGEDRFHWDLFHSDMNPLLSNKQTNLIDQIQNYFRLNMARHYNDEIVVLVLMSSIGACITSVSSYLLYFGMNRSCCLILLIVYIGFIVYKSCRIYQITKTKHFIEMESCEYRLHYLNKAKDNHIVTEDEYHSLKEKAEYDKAVAKISIIDGIKEALGR